MSTEPAAPVIEPMGVGRVVDTALRLARRHFWAQLRLGAWAIIPAQVISAALQVATDLQSPGGAAAANAFIAITAIAQGLTLYASLIAYSRIIEGNPDSRAGSIYGVVFRAIPRAIGAMIIAIVAAIPLIIIFPLGIYVFVRWALSGPALLIEGQGPLGALRRSWGLTRGLWWHTALALFVAALIVAVLSIAAGLLALPGTLLSFVFGQLAAGTLASTLLGTIGGLLVFPFQNVVGVVLYYELRARSEGFDLTQRARELAGRGEAPWPA